MAQVFDNINEYKGISIRLASPNDIRDWSYGEVKKAETINYRTYRAEKDGLFCQKIFGPEKDYECYCGKYKGIRYKNIICDRCGVKVTTASVRRQRMGHINLAEPVVHIWFFRNVPSRLGNLLAMTSRDLHSVIYYQRYIVTDPGDTDLKHKQILTEEEYQEAKKKYKGDFEARMGARAIRELLRQLDLDALSFELREQLRNTRSKTTRNSLVKRIQIVESLLRSPNKPEWMVLDVIPVIPPDLRPLVPLDSGTFATSDLNDLYRRVISRNNRLKKLFELNAPSVIVRNEMRMLQQSVDALFHNGSLRRPVQGSTGRPLKALSDMISGKQGRFRENLLGKRVDYSARSVIVVGPHLRLHQTGLPKKIALELFQPFIINKLRERGYADTLKNAKRIIERQEEEVWDILEEVTRDHPVLLNRAPTLHRMGIQAFMPVLIEGEAIQLHPLVCQGYNADFDGDQMAVHLPLSYEAQLEAEFMMLSTENILSPANGSPIITADQDIVLGCYFLTFMDEERAKEETEANGRVFSGLHEALYAYEAGKIGLHEPIRVKFPRKKKVLGAGGKMERLRNRICVTTVGRLLFNDILPEGMSYYNRTLDKKALRTVIDDCYRKLGRTATVKLLDRVKQTGFHYATLSGMTFALSFLTVPPEKKEFIAEAEKKIQRLNSSYRRGLITAGERYNQVIDIWNETVDKVTKALEEVLKQVRYEDGKPVLNPIYVMANSGARGSMSQVRQLAGMRGLMAKPSGEIIETPIKASFTEGLSVFEYFSSTHGARKGLADTALKTADSGYLTRRLVEVAQDVVITMDDCGTRNGIKKEAVFQGEEKVVSLADNIVGRVARDNIVDPITDEVIVKENELITMEKARQIEDIFPSIIVRSPLTCEAPHGICAKCYGADLSMGRMVELGTAVGIIAAQSIGEPGTQLTLRTFHIGGTAALGRRDPVVRARRAGTVKFEGLDLVELTPEHAERLRVTYEERDRYLVVSRRGAIVILDDRGREVERYPVQQAAHIKVAEGEKVRNRQPLFSRNIHATPLLTERDGLVRFVDFVVDETVKVERDQRTGQVSIRVIEHRGDKQPQVEIIQAVKAEHEGFLVNKSAVLEERGAEHHVEAEGEVEIVDENGKVLETLTVPAGYRLTVRAASDREKAVGRITVPHDENLSPEERLKRLLSLRLNEVGIVAYQSSIVYNLPEKSVVSAHPFEHLLKGMEIAKTPREIAGTQDITGGLPRVQELFEARTPKDKAEIAEVSGTVEIGSLRNKKREIIIHAEGGPELDRSYRVPQGRRLLVQTGDHVEAGDPLTDGPIDPKDLLRVSGSERLQSYLLEEIQNVYRSQNVRINDKHIEIIIRQMFSKVVVQDPGDTELLPNQEVSRSLIAEINAKAAAEGRHTATFLPVLKGIMKQGVNAESFISAASFQETSKVLTNAAIAGKFDPLRGLKENVIVGHIIPAGTGFSRFLEGTVEYKGEPVECPTEEDEDYAEVGAAG